MFSGVYEDCLDDVPDEVLVARMEKYLENLPPPPSFECDGAADECDWREFDGLCDMRTPTSDTLSATRFEPRTPPPLDENRDAGEEPLPPPPLFSFVKVTRIDSALSLFLRGIREEETVVHEQWPSEIPAPNYFFGNDDLGVIDFGGKKSGTLYPGCGSYSLLVK